MDLLLISLRLNKTEYRGLLHAPLIILINMLWINNQPCPNANYLGKKKRHNICVSTKIYKRFKMFIKAYETLKSQYFQNSYELSQYNDITTLSNLHKWFCYHLVIYFLTTIFLMNGITNPRVIIHGSKK